MTELATAIAGLVIGWAVGAIFATIGSQVIARKQDETIAAQQEVIDAQEELLEHHRLSIPDVEDSPAWTRTSFPPDPAGPGVSEALGLVLALGKKLRCCADCGQVTTNSAAFEYENVGGQTRVNIYEKCQSCGFGANIQVSDSGWACMEAARAWEGTCTARALFKSETQRDL